MQCAVGASGFRSAGRSWPPVQFEHAEAAETTALYQDNISALIHEPTFKQTAGDAVFAKAKVIVTLGNRGPLDRARDREFEVAGMPNSQGVGYVDYVLWGDDGKPLGVIEAKRTRRDSRVGQQQAKLYADSLEQMFGQRPIIFYSNGYEHWMWDDTNYPPRAVQGFYKKDELELLIQRRNTRKSLAQANVNDTIIKRY